MKNQSEENQLQALLPSFIIGGAAKSGTTSLSRYLNQHPGIFIPEKEPNFFTYAGGSPGYTIINHNFVYDLEKYKQLLKPYGDNAKSKVIGEKSVSYLYSGYYNQVITNIMKLYADPQHVKWIFILRNPIDRAFSQYVHNLNFYENLTFENAIQQWESRKVRGWIPAYDYLGAGFYSESIQAYMKRFRNVRVYLFEDLIQHPKWLLNDIFEFLNMKNDTMEIIFDHHNKSAIPRNKMLEKSFEFLGNSKVLSTSTCVIPKKLKHRIKKFTHRKPNLDEQIKNSLKSYYSEEIKILEKLIDRSLSGWLGS